MVQSLNCLPFRAILFEITVNMLGTEDMYVSTSVKLCISITLLLER